MHKGLAGFLLPHAVSGYIMKYRQKIGMPLTDTTTALYENFWCRCNGRLWDIADL